MKYRVFIDGAEGTTGLKIHEYFKRRDDIELVNIEESKRKNLEARAAMIKEADISFLCLPDKAAREISDVLSPEDRLIDTSSAHRTAPGWVYGMPELCKNQRELIKKSRRVAVPGCHASGAILIIKPLIALGIIDEDYPFAITSLTGYSGGGKKMIKEYEEGETTPHLQSPRQYGITQEHKHLPEIKKMTGMHKNPAFIPVVGSYYSGMEVIISLDTANLRWKGWAEEPTEAVKKIYREYYGKEELVKVVDKIDDNGFISANRAAGNNGMEICVNGSLENIVLTASYDNLGKGASGAAIQNMNIMLGIDERKGLL
ncbi:MAG: N-acetyl-gamma-glutamyl-phosphate reductase [Clostridiales bacterium]|nr:N-acetyl-gamma-glutamyl-phosphate reductase [Clostridiales bacterium]